MGAVAINDKATRGRSGWFGILHSMHSVVNSGVFITECTDYTE